MNGDYTVLVAGRFLVEARASQTEIDTVQGAVAAVDLGKLEALKDFGAKN